MELEKQVSVAEKREAELSAKSEEVEAQRSEVGKALADVAEEKERLEGLRKELEIKIKVSYISLSYPLSHTFSLSLGH